MIDLDNGPLVFMLWIAIVFLLPALYGMLLVDAHWKKHQSETAKDDVFN